MSPYESQIGNSSMGKDLKIQTIREVAEKSKVGLGRKKQTIPINHIKMSAEIPGPCLCKNRFTLKLLIETYPN